jgi:hypothetical protein
MVDRAPRDLPARARHGARVLVVMLGLLLVLAVPAVVVAAEAGASAAPAATSNPGEPGSGDTGTGWVRKTPSASESLVPIMLGGVVLVILVVVIAMSTGESAKA